MRGNRLPVLRCLHGLPGQSCYLESPRPQQAKHTTSAKHLVIGTGLCQNTRTLSFPNRRFLYSCRNKYQKVLQALTAKPVTGFPELFIIPLTFKLSNISASANVFCAPTETLVQRTNDANKVGQAFF